MIRFTAWTFLLLLVFLFNPSWSQIEQPYPPLNLVSIPTAGTLPRGSFTLESLLIKHGGVVPRLSVGFTDNFNFGVSFGIQNLIGNEKPFNGVGSVSLFLDEPDIEERVLLGENSTINLLYEYSTYDLEIYIFDEEGEIIGGYKGDWITSYLDFKDKSEVVFKVIEYIPKPTTDEEKLDLWIYMMEGNYTEELRPRFE